MLLKALTPGDKHEYLGRRDLSEPLTKATPLLLETCHIQSMGRSRLHGAYPRYLLDTTGLIPKGAVLQASSQ
jgi:hypothetical protein